MFDFFDILGGGFGEAGGGGLFDGLADLLFGSMDGGGLLGGFTESGGIFEGLGGRGMAFEDLLGGAARGGFATEGAFSRLLGLFSEGADLYIDYIVYKDILGKTGSYSNFKSAWGQMGDDAKQAVEHVSEVIKGHGFILQQLRAHKDEAGIAEVLQEYGALGLTLPSKDLTNTAWKKLAKFLHTDRGAIDATLMTQLNNARDALDDMTKRAAYESALHNNRAGVEELFAKLSKTDWKHVYEATEQRARLRLTGPAAEETYTGARKWLSELSANQRGALIFAAVTGVGLGTYFGVRALEHRREKRRHPEGDALLHTQRIEQQQHETPGMAAHRT